MIIQEPFDGWGGITPRRWQAECYAILLQHYSVPQPTPACVRAIMGSGKSILEAQIAASAQLATKDVIVVSTSNIFLVQQLERTFRERLEGDGIMTSQRVGTYYTHGKDVSQPIIITCLPSLPELAERLKMRGRIVAMWIADEFHRTETDLIKASQIALMPRSVLGFTATPFRADDEERLTLAQKLLYDYGPAVALADKNVVVPWRIIAWTGGETTLDDACMQMTKDAHGPGMFNAICIRDAEEFAKTLNAAGVTAEAVHSKMGEATVKHRLDALRKGDLKAVVHVAMLQEGADFPWLRWLCMRRPVGSKVRFAQEIGRTLRYWKDPVTGEEKTEAVLYDPHSLASVFSLDYAAVLGGEYGVDAPDQQPDEAELMAKAMQDSLFGMMEALVGAKATQAPLSVTPLAAYLTELINAFDVCHLIERRIASRRWRAESVTAKQMASLPKMRWASGRKCVPPMHQEALSMLTGQGECMTRGVASDLLTILHSLADTKKWPDLKHIDQAAEEGIKRTHERKQQRRTFSGPQLTEPAAPHIQGVLFEGSVFRPKRRGGK